MSVVIDKIKALDHNVFTKQEKIIRGITECLEEESLAFGDALPSVNKLSDNLGYARETVVKAYSSLKDRGIIQSKHGLGYFVVDETPDRHLSIALVLYGFQNFQQEFYNQFRRQLGNNYKIDVFFHHNNLTMYESVLQSINRKYGMYVIAPIQSDQAKIFLHLLPEEKLIIIDRYLDVGTSASYVTQEFEKSLLIEFEKIKDEIFRFDQHIVFFKNGMDYPPGILRGLEKFFGSNDTSLQVYDEFDPTHLKTNSFYVTIGDTDLWRLMKEAKQHNIVIGEDIGVISHNDSIVKEFVADGVSTFSTNFERMADETALCIKNKSVVRKVIPSALIRRKSF